MLNIKFTFCRDCLYWKEIEDSEIRCWKYAPKPKINNSLDSVIQDVIWPATKAHQGCFEGNLKVPDNIWDAAERASNKFE